ncbi:head-tail connector protein [Pararhizobium sp. YC-54]|uniref:head-tail connector protein n=1 Tax=Pararhizobium sp. YC-54 TaxID=2986920 RepID=UPI0021F79DC2|nr:head-tail connector protein [Pararhizobium sp. YC-54]MCV9997677.1 head-tail connector protein [Pararhizobium sp. YC-54]
MILSLEELKQQLNLTEDFGDADDALLTRKISAAQDHLERMLGYKVEATYGGIDQDPVPPALIEAVALLAGHLYENREATLVGVSAQELPLGIHDIVSGYREWTVG